MDSAVVQMNVRIDSQLKNAGDRVLERAGLSPTKAVRALWERLASFSDAPEKAVELLFPSEGGSVSSIEAERARKLKVARESAPSWSDWGRGGSTDDGPSHPPA